MRPSFEELLVGRDVHGRGVGGAVAVTAVWVGQKGKRPSTNAPKRALASQLQVSVISSNIHNKKSLLTKVQRKKREKLTTTWEATRCNGREDLPIAPSVLVRYEVYVCVCETQSTYHSNSDVRMPPITRLKQRGSGGMHSGAKVLDLVPCILIKQIATSHYYFHRISILKASTKTQSNVCIEIACTKQ